MKDEHPSVAQVREAVQMFVGHCGLNGHQYVFGLHHDTEHLHVHIAINRVDPLTLKVTKINKGFDREAAHQAIAIIEKKQGWREKEGARYRANECGELLIDPKTKRPQKARETVIAKKPSAAAQTKEFHTGEKSAQRMAQEIAAPIIQKVGSWQELHRQLAAQGIRYEKKGSGAVIYIGNVAVKASDADRKASLSALQKRFGEYKVSGIAPNKAAINSMKHAQPLKPQQTGWQEYQHIRATQNAAKAAEALALQTQQARERQALFVRLKTERERVLRRDWKGQGVLRNAMHSVLATKQAADRLGLSERHKAERCALRAKFKPLPMYREWVKLPMIVAMEVHPQYVQWQFESLSKLLQSLTYSSDKRGHVTYRTATFPAISTMSRAVGHVTYRTATGTEVFRDEGRMLAVLNPQSDAAIAAALAVGMQKFGGTLTLTGSVEFQRKAVAVAVANGMDCRFSDLAMNTLREELRVAAQMERQREAERARELVLLAQEQQHMNALALDSEPLLVEPPPPKWRVDAAMRDFTKMFSGRQNPNQYYKDGGANWESIPVPLQRKIDAIIALPQVQRSAALAHKREQFECNPQALVVFEQQLKQRKQAEKGLGR